MGYVAFRCMKNCFWTKKVAPQPKKTQTILISLFLLDLDLFWLSGLLLVVVFVFGCGVFFFGWAAVFFLVRKLSPRPRRRPAEPSRTPAEKRICFHNICDVHLCMCMCMCLCLCLCMRVRVDTSFLFLSLSLVYRISYCILSGPLFAQEVEQVKNASFAWISWAGATII